MTATATATTMLPPLNWQVPRVRFLALLTLILRGPSIVYAVSQTLLRLREGHPYVLFTAINTRSHPCSSHRTTSAFASADTHAQG
jgi:hypothetical protein